MQSDEICTLNGKSSTRVSLASNSQGARSNSPLGLWSHSVHIRLIKHQGSSRLCLVLVACALGVATMPKQDWNRLLNHGRHRISGSDSLPLRISSDADPCHTEYARSPCIAPFSLLLVGQRCGAPISQLARSGMKILACLPRRKRKLQGGTGPPVVRRW